MEMPVVLNVELPGIPLFRRGKVRELFDLGDTLLLVATDRLSAFDVVLPNGIPGKGIVLTQLSAFWFEWFAERVPSHYLTTELPEQFSAYRGILQGRSMLVRKAERIPVECVARGYLAGSAWAEYRTSGMVAGVRLPCGLRESERLPEPLFTPAVKSDTGHDENITFDELVKRVGEELAERLRERTLEIYVAAERYARERGVIIADTKLEFGWIGGELAVIDELLTPDSSRFWDVEQYEPGRPQPSFDKQFVRDWLLASGWNKQPPAPALPPDVVEKTAEKYREAYRRLTGRPVPYLDVRER
ncbi:phosphoribosylaminoimidazolesuccinocarboxamide synthase [Thermomicrobium sp. CFH 73360]|uniref:phosphoribosylaminoimidazolesuccinocarboxamide synthase n=1 Tax=Thermomicrobium sp. CFH 73360 TaxID=2951987 RepID=UPI002076D9B0|nr:phosphoribosylaminoimidazolesuccinocarboxamide synthase [Thermomicrobium sp. CFH 73360]MCM8746647.1 phosphoribosylaminoimidazolesuccinocarboxamide synthase [Thermomicrobium sp. CFH 73360]